MKQTLIILLIAVCAGCKGKPETTVQKIATTKPDSNVDVATKSIGRLDSGFYWFEKEMDYNTQYNHYKELYYQTAKESYRIKANKYKDSTHTAYLKLHAVAQQTK